MGIRIGTSFMGEVDKAGGQSIQTKFFIFGLPVFPIESLLVTEQGWNERTGVPIPLHGKSVLAGYVRWWGLLVPMVTSILIDGRGMRTAAIVCGLLAVAAYICLGWLAFRLTPDERRRREMLGAVTGLALLPEVLPPQVAKRTLTALEEALDEAGIDADPRAWRDALPEDGDMPLLHAYAAYARWAGLARGWSVVEANTLEALAGRSARSKRVSRGTAPRPARKVAPRAN